jgi:hypothetical protein
MGFLSEETNPAALGDAIPRETTLLGLKCFGFVFFRSRIMGIGS